MANKTKKAKNNTTNLYTAAKKSPEMLRADQERRRSGAAGFHVSGRRGERSRSGARRAAIAMAW